MRDSRRRDPDQASRTCFDRSAPSCCPGTNLMTNLMRKNCVMPLGCPADMGQKKKMEAMARKECLGYPFQTPWGKHNPVAWRDDHVVESLSHFNSTEILPVVARRLFAPACDPATREALYADAVAEHASWRQLAYCVSYVGAGVCGIGSI